MTPSAVPKSTVGYDSRAVEAHATVDLDILVRQRIGFGQEGTGQLPYFKLRVACVLDQLFGHTQESTGRPGQIDRGWPGCIERLFGLAQLFEQALAVAGRADVRGERHAVCCCRSDSGRAAHVHLTDAASHLEDRIKFCDDLLARQQALVDHLHLPVLPVDGAHRIFPLAKRNPSNADQRGGEADNVLIFRAAGGSSELAQAEQTERR